MIPFYLGKLFRRSGHLKMFIQRCIQIIQKITKLMEQHQDRCSRHFIVTSPYKYAANANMGGLVHQGIVSCRSSAIEKAESDIRHKYALREETKRELEYILKGGNPLDFRRGNTASELEGCPQVSPKLLDRAHEDSILQETRIIQAKRKRLDESYSAAVPLDYRRKSHWDFILEEMAWLANDFAQERRWKICAAALLSHKIAGEVCLSMPEMLQDGHLTEENLSYVVPPGAMAEYRRSVELTWEDSRKRGSSFPVNVGGNSGRIKIARNFGGNQGKKSKSLKCMFRTPNECKEQYRRLIDNSSGDGGESSGSSHLHNTPLLEVPKGNARLLRERKEEDTLKSHFEKIVLVSQKSQIKMRKINGGDKKLIQPHPSHAHTLSQFLPRGHPLTPLDMCDAKASELPSFGYQSF